MPQRKEFSVQEVEEMRALKKAGEKMRVIGERFDLSRSQVDRLTRSPPLDDETRGQLVAAYNGNLPVTELARTFDLPVDLCRRVLKFAGVKVTANGPIPLNVSEGERVCSICKENKPLSAFQSRKDRPCGTLARCKECSLAYARKWRKESPKARAIAERSQVKRRGNRSDYNRIYKKTNAAKMKAYKHGYQAKRKQASGKWTAKEWEELLAFYGDKCLRCGATPVVVEHIISLSTFGKNTIDNLQPLCAKCNSWKRSRTVDFRPDKSSLVPWIEKP